MELNLVKQIFEDTGFHSLYDKFSYQIYVTGLFDLVDQQSIIEEFLDSYDFNENHTLLFDDFSYFFRSFQYSLQKAEYCSILQPEWD
ncbi:hypothetical protein [Peribacillus sp. NPDC097225]|uniref:hypothetical protein n=1 Tax=Peribacillus sp. NPDC097225 TaxID=3364400 RepID=UPI00380626F7